MSSSHSKDHWQSLRELLGLPPSPAESAAGSQVSAQPQPEDLSESDKHRQLQPEVPELPCAVSDSSGSEATSREASSLVETVHAPVASQTASPEGAPEPCASSEPSGTTVLGQQQTPESMTDAISEAQASRAFPSADVATENAPVPGGTGETAASGARSPAHGDLGVTTTARADASAERTTQPGKPPQTGSPSKSVGNIRNHWGKLAAALGLPVSIDVPAETSRPAKESPKESDEAGGDLLAYEVPPVETSETLDSDWREHQGEFDSEVEPTVLEDAPRKPDSEEPDLWEPESASDLLEDELEVETEQDLDTDSAIDTESSEEEAERRRIPRRRRRRHRRRGRHPSRLQEATATYASEDEGEPFEEVPAATSAPASEERTACAEDAQAARSRSEVSDVGGSDEDLDSDEVSVRKHVKIPTWQQAVSYIIDHNLAQRGRGGQDTRRGRTPRSDR